MSFWQKLKKPIMVLAPMAGVTDAAFRRVIAKYGKPDITWTEFVSADGLVRGNRELLSKDLMFNESERPIVAQFFTAKPEYMAWAAKYAEELGFDGIDINMGCPDKNVNKQGSGAAMIKTPQLAVEIIEAAKSATTLPVSVKTRSGWNTDTLEEWLPHLLCAKPAAIIIHARNKKDMSKVPARWSLVKQAVEMRNAIQSETLILGNGDLLNLADAHQKVKESGADGAMLGRAIFGNPWLFNKEIQKEKMPYRDRLEALIEHILLFDRLLGRDKHFALMKKHFKSYLSGIPHTKDLLLDLMNAEKPHLAISLLQKHISLRE